MDEEQDEQSGGRDGGMKGEGGGRYLPPRPDLSRMSEPAKVESVGSWAAKALSGRTQPSANRNNRSGGKEQPVTGSGEGGVDGEVEEGSPMPAGNERTLGMLCHLLALLGLVIPVLGNVVGPLGIWVAKRRESPVVGREGKKSANFQILFSMLVLLLFFPLYCLAWVPFFGPLVVVGYSVLIGLASVANVVFVVMGAVAVSGKRQFEYPLRFDLLGAIERRLAE